MLFRGRPTLVRVETGARHAGNRIVFEKDRIVTRRGANSDTPITRSLENWLRKEARREIERLLTSVTGRLKRSPRRNLRDGTANQMGQLLRQAKSLFQLAPHFDTRIRASILRHATKPFILQYPTTHPRFGSPFRVFVRRPKRPDDGFEKTATG